MRWSPTLCALLWALLLPVISSRIVSTSELLAPSKLPLSTASADTQSNAMGTTRPFGSLTILLVGDSTIRGQWDWMDQHLRKGLTLEEMYRLPNSDDDTFVPSETLKGKDMVSHHGNVTVVYQRAYPKPADVNVRDVVTAVTNDGLSPDVIYVNIGLWLLHLVPVRNHTSFTDIQCWLDYGNFAKNSVRTFQETFPRAKVVFMTSHSICDKAYSGDYAAHLQMNETIRQQECKSHLKTQYPQLSEEDATDVCTNGLLNRDGVVHLNNKLIAALDSLDTPVAIVDGFGQTDNRCDRTAHGDGRHYNALIRSECQQFLEHLPTVHEGTSMPVPMTNTDPNK